MPDPDIPLPYLLHRAETHLATVFNQHAKRFGVNVQTWRVLFALIRSDGQRVSELADNTSIEVSTLSHLLTRMSGNGLITREREGSDQRSVRIHLTEAGERLGRRVSPLAEHQESIALHGFDADEVETLKVMLERISNNVTAA